MPSVASMNLRIFMPGIGCLGDIAVPNPSGEIYPFAEESSWAAIANESRSGPEVEILSDTGCRGLFYKPLGVSELELGKTIYRSEYLQGGMACHLQIRREVKSSQEMVHLIHLLKGDSR